MLFFFVSALFIAALVGLVVSPLPLRKRIYTGFKEPFQLLKLTLFKNELIGIEGNKANVSQITETNEEEIEQSKLKLEEIENDLNQLKNQANQVKFSYRLAIIQLIETLQMLEKSLQEDRVVLATLEPQIMTGAPQKTVTGKVPSYKICCLIPQQIDDQDIVYLSSASEVNRFLQIHGIAGRFRVDSGKSSIATCTKDLSTTPEVGQLQLISNASEERSKETYDRQIQLDWKNVNSMSCYRNEIVPWHKCNKNDSLIHFCKKSNCSIYTDANNFFIRECTNNGEQEFSKLNKHIFEVNEFLKKCETNELKKHSSKNSKYKLNKNKTKNNRSFKGIFKKHCTPEVKLDQNVRTEEKEKEKSTVYNNLIDKRISLLVESIICETTESEVDKPGEMAANCDMKGNVKEISTVIADDLSKKYKLPLPIINSESTKNVSTSLHRDIENIEKTTVSSCEWLDTVSVESTVFDCQSDEKQNKNEDLTFYESPTKFIEDMSECVMKSFIDQECDTSWVKMNTHKKILNKCLGINLDLSTLYILKQMGQHQTSDSLLSHLTPRQRRLMAVTIVNSLKEFNISGSSWGGMAREILKKVCKIFKSQRAFVL